MISAAFLHFFSRRTIGILVSIYQVIRRALDTMYKGCAKMRLYKKKWISSFPYHPFSLCRMMGIFASIFRVNISTRDFRSARDTMYVGCATIRFCSNKWISSPFLHFSLSQIKVILMFNYQVFRSAPDTMYAASAKM